MNTFYVYILTNKKHGTLYCGFTNNLIRSAYEHRNGLLNGFTKKHAIKKLVYYEKLDNAEKAINWNDYIKNLAKEDRFELIEKNNPHWKDLYYDMGGDDEYDFYDEQLKRYRKDIAYQ